MLRKSLTQWLNATINFVFKIIKYYKFIKKNVDFITEMCCCVSAISLIERKRKKSKKKSLIKKAAEAKQTFPFFVSFNFFCVHFSLILIAVADLFLEFNCIFSKLPRQISWIGFIKNFTIKLHKYFDSPAYNKLPWFRFFLLFFTTNQIHIKKNPFND